VKKRVVDPTTNSKLWNDESAGIIVPSNLKIASNGKAAPKSYAHQDSYKGK